jgi:hypothetical protein
MARWEDRNPQRVSLSVVASNSRLRVEQLLICTDGGPFAQINLRTLSREQKFVNRFSSAAQMPRHGIYGATDDASRP